MGTPEIKTRDKEWEVKLRESPPGRMKDKDYVGYDMPDEAVEDLQEDLEKGEKDKRKHKHRKGSRR